MTGNLGRIIYWDGRVGRRASEVQIRTGSHKKVRSLPENAEANGMEILKKDRI